MSPLTEQLLKSLLLGTSLMSCVWVLSLIRRDASVIDPVWGMGFVLVAWFDIASATQLSARSWLLATLTTIWGLRLSLYLLWRNWGHGEDRRYQAMRESIGAQFWWVSLGTVFLLQSLLLWIVSFPIQVAIFDPEMEQYGWLDLMGIAVWTIGLFFESVGDFQMARFQADPHNAGQVMDRGLWSLTRHPNYFGDFCIWWGLYLIAAAGGASWTVFSPILMSFLLLKVSGVTLLEHNITDRRPDYADYQARVSPFFPWYASKSRNGQSSST